MRLSLFILGGQLTIAVEVIAVETITVEAIAVHPGGGQLMIAVEAITVETITVEMITVEAILLRQMLLRASTQNCIMGIVRCIMGNAFCSTTDLQVPSVCTSFVKFGIYWEKNKEDRLVHNHEISVPPPPTFRAKHGLATSSFNFLTDQQYICLVRC